MPIGGGHKNAPGLLIVVSLTFNTTRVGKLAGGIKSSLSFPTRVFYK